MGYACPVCDLPQRDAEHLANHLAFTALTHGDDHEAWLDEHAPGWAEEGPDELADRVTAHAEVVEYDEVFEDTVSASGHRGQGHGHERPIVDDGDAAAGGEALDPEARSVLEEARAMTREMLDAADSTAEGEDDDR